MVRRCHMPPPSRRSPLYPPALSLGSRAVRLARPSPFAPRGRFVALARASPRSRWGSPPGCTARRVSTIGSLPRLSTALPRPGQPLVAGLAVDRLRHAQRRRGRGVRRGRDQAVHVPSRKTRTLFQTSNDAVCGEASFSPIANERARRLAGPGTPRGRGRTPRTALRRPRGRRAEAQRPREEAPTSGRRRRRLRRRRRRSKSVAADDRSTSLAATSSPTSAPSPRPTKRPFGGSIAGSLRRSRAAPSSPNNRSNTKPARPRTSARSARLLTPGPSPRPTGRFTAGALAGPARRLFPDGAMVAAARGRGPAAQRRVTRAVQRRGDEPPRGRGDVLAGGGVTWRRRSTCPRRAGFTVASRPRPARRGGTDEDARASDACWVGRRCYALGRAGGRGRVAGPRGGVFGRGGEAAARERGGPEKIARAGAVEEDVGLVRARPARDAPRALRPRPPRGSAALRAAAGLNAPLAGTDDAPSSPRGCAQRRVTRTDRRVFPGAGARKRAEGGGGEDADPCGAVRATVSPARRRAQVHAPDEPGRSVRVRVRDGRLGRPSALLGSRRRRRGRRVASGDAASQARRAERVRLVRRRREHRVRARRVGVFGARARSEADRGPLERDRERVAVGDGVGGAFSSAPRGPISPRRRGRTARRGSRGRRFGPERPGRRVCGFPRAASTWRTCAG